MSETQQISNIEQLQEIRKLIRQKQSRKNYLLNKKKINKQRKSYKRQSWSERKDNPKNKKK